MTPGEWAEGQQLIRTYRETRDRSLDFTYAEHERDDFSRLADHARFVANWWLMKHADELIDAARPRCQRCAQPPRVWVGWVCPDCNGTGWAA